MKVLLPLVAFILVAEAAAAGEPLGRLFFTPAQRAQLDAARAGKGRAPAAEAEEPPLPHIITYGGIVRRSDGKTTVWINNRAVDGDRSADSPALPGEARPDGSVLLRLPHSDRTVRLRVGQSVEVVSGTIEEPYARKPLGARPPEKLPAAGKAPATSTVPGTTHDARSDASPQHAERSER